MLQLTRFTGSGASAQGGRQGAGVDAGGGRRAWQWRLAKGNDERRCEDGQKREKCECVARRVLADAPVRQMTEPLVLAWAQRRGPTQQGQSKINHKPHRAGLIRCALGATLHETDQHSRAAQATPTQNSAPNRANTCTRPGDRVALQCVVLQCVQSVCALQCAVCALQCAVCTPRNGNDGRGLVSRPCLT